MKNIIKQIAREIIIVIGSTLIISAGIVYAGSITQPYGGGTGTNVVPSSGQVLIASGTAYVPAFLTAGSNVTIATSSGSITINGTAGAGASTTINGALGPFTFSTTTGNNYFSISTSSQTVTFNLSNVLQTINGLATTTGNVISGTGNATGWQSISTSSLGLVNSINGLTGTITGLNLYNTTTSINGLTGMITGLNIYNTTTSINGLTGAITGLNIYNTTTTLSGLTGSININTSSTVLISTSTGNIYFSAPEKCDLGFTIENPTSTVGTLDNSPGDIIGFFASTSTITRVRAVNTAAGDTVNFNLTYNSNRNSATSTFRVFSSQQTSNSTSTVQTFTPNASSTPNRDDVLRVSFSTASSTHFHIDLCYKEN